MSRSYKKYRILSTNDKSMKTHSSRKLRRASKNAIQKDEENMPLKKEIMDPYEIKHGRWVPSKKDKKWYDKAKRK